MTDAVVSASAIWPDKMTAAITPNEADRRKEGDTMVTY